MITKKFLESLKAKFKHYFIHVAISFDHSQFYHSQKVATIIKQYRPHEAG